MKKNFLFLPAALLLMGSMALTACSDDDDTAAITDTELTDTESETARAAARVLNALAEVEELPTGWASKTYDATVGEQLDDANPTVRTLAVADAAEASSYFAGITSQTLDEGTTTASYSVGKLGTLNLRPGNEAGCYAVIDVDFTLMPNLKQIRLVDPSLLPDNDGGKEPYYAWGDILYDENDMSFWICGRPANPDLGKKKTYWFSFDIKEKHYYKLSSDSHKYQQVLKNLNSTSDKASVFGELLYLLALGQNSEAINKYLDQNQKALENWGPAAKEQVTTAAKGWNEHNKFEEVLPVAFTQNYLDYFTGYSFFIDEYSRFLYKMSVPVVNVKVSPETYTYNARTGTLTWDIREEGCTLDDYVYSGLRGYALVNMTNKHLPKRGLAVRMRTGRQLSTQLVGTPDYDKELPGTGSKLTPIFIQNPH